MKVRKRLKKKYTSLDAHVFSYVQAFSIETKQTYSGNKDGCCILFIFASMHPKVIYSIRDRAYFNIMHLQGLLSDTNIQVYET